MKKILYDNQMFTFQRFGGVTRYFADLLYNLPSNEFVGELPMVFCENHYVTNTYGREYRTLSFPKNYRIRRRIYQIANRVATLHALRTGGYDIFHPTYYSPYFLPFVKQRKRAFVLTIHDMTFERFPQDVLIYDRTIPHKKKLIKEADHIIAVSENTKRDIVELLGTDASKISVVHHGFQPGGEVAPQLFDRYILYVGERKGYKNFLPWLSAVRQLLVLDPTLKIVCTGSDFTPSECEIFKNWGVADSIIHIAANDAQMASLYRHALCFVFPSLYEGFGIPILEAFSNNCPVCLSNASCFPEVAGDAAIYFEPQNAQSMYDVLREVITKPTLRDELRMRGNERIKDFSLQKMVKETCDVYRNVL
ncbi:MAG: glycosyltransferase family 4 protein [Bacteroidaceae bacterium]|nr:glycosyltransferase family 4 protein [Bacteroidaceae bacterium]MBR5276506.1 glycosyltransferase family 4 protein [Bacteroidaceae bacterium]MBR5891123.1 glycosyltransferase family 4 protein [Bacteroidaceae bacterium]